MKEISNELEYRGIKYKLVFNLNVMEEIQQKYGSLAEWGNLTDGKQGEPDAKAIIFGFNAMLNEGIDIENEENDTDIKPLTLRQTGRIVTGIGLNIATEKLNNTVIESTQSAEKNE